MVESLTSPPKILTTYSVCHCKLYGRVVLLLRSYQKVLKYLQLAAAGVVTQKACCTAFSNVVGAEANADW
jgi:hypothetical protein